MTPDWFQLQDAAFAQRRAAEWYGEAVQQRCSKRGFKHFPLTIAMCARKAAEYSKEARRLMGLEE